MPYNTDDDDGCVTMMWSFSFEQHFREYSAGDLMCPLQNENDWVNNCWLACEQKTMNSKWIASILPRMLLNFVPGLWGVTLIIGTILLFMWKWCCCCCCCCWSWNVVQSIHHYYTSLDYHTVVLQSIKWIPNDEPVEALTPESFVNAEAEWKCTGNEK